MPLFAVKNNRKPDSSREGMLEGLSLGIYLLLVEYTVTLFRAGNPAEPPSSFDPPPRAPDGSRHPPPQIQSSRADSSPPAARGFERPPPARASTTWPSSPDAPLDNPRMPCTVPATRGAPPITRPCIPVRRSHSSERPRARYAVRPARYKPCSARRANGGTLPPGADSPADQTNQPQARNATPVLPIALATWPGSGLQARSGGIWYAEVCSTTGPPNSEQLC
jgi:hypothetical protein